MGTPHSAGWWLRCVAGPTGRRVRLESEKGTEVFSGRKTWCRRGESNPHESHPSPDFESGRAPAEKLRKAHKTLGIRGFSPEQGSDSLSRIEFPRWTKSGRRNSASDIEANSR